MVYGMLVAPVLPVTATINSEETVPANDVLAGPADGTETINPTSNRQVSPAAAQALRFAYLTSSRGSVLSFKQHAADLDAVLPDWLELTQENGRVRISVDADSAEIHRWVGANAPQLKVYPILTNRLGSRETSMALTINAVRETIIEDILRYLDQNSLPGLALQIPDANRVSERVIVSFIHELRGRLSQQQRKLIVIMSLTDNVSRIGNLSRLSDYTLVMTHDGMQDGRPAPIAPQGWIESKLAALFAWTDPGRVIVGVGSFAVDWGPSGRMRQMSVPVAWTRMQDAGTSLKFDQRSLNATFRYRDRDGQPHEVWLLDGVSCFNQLRAALSYRPAGIALWPLGDEDASVWPMWARTKLPDPQALRSLETLKPGNEFFTNLNAALLSAAPGHSGKRVLGYNDRLGLITRQAITAVPLQAQVITSSPTAKNLIALTFDDGPDPTYTAKILDILQTKAAKATFYVIGRNAVQSPGLLKRIYDEGHDIGNHTFSHPRLMGSGRDRIAIELNMAQRVIEAETGVRTTLFRPPEAYTGLAYLDDAQQLVEAATELGYQIGALDIDTFDWAVPRFLGIRKAHVIERVVDKVVNGQGRILLMHDSGGDRQLTVDALPDIIDQLQARGFRFVATHELVGKARDAVMPPTRVLSFPETLNAEFWRIGPQSVSWLATTVPLIAISATILAICRLTLIIIGATLHRLKGSAPTPPEGWQPRGIAVLVPAYNEAVVIRKTIETLVASTMAERIAIIVVDDGSTDETAAIVREAFAHNPTVQVLTKPNGGKAAALNFGLQFTSAEIIVAIDGDTVLLPDAVERLVGHFADPRIGAVAGTVSVGNRHSLIARFQALEYTMSQSLDRRALQLVNAIGVVPGAIGAWRRDALLAVGGYSSDTLAEDADLTISLELAGWKVVSEPRARALTEVPERLRAFLRQRFRWMFGTLQVAYKHAGAGLRLRPSALILITNVLLFQFLFTLLAPLMDAILVFSLAASILDVALTGWTSQGDETIELLIVYWLVFQIFDLLAGIAALILHGRSQDWRLLPLLVLQRFSYRQLLYVTAVRTLLTALKGTFVGWGKLVRTGSVDPTVASA